ncbi:hypothetical protein ALCH109712_17070 [Alkalicoccus chagannorensis]
MACWFHSDKDIGFMKRCFQLSHPFQQSTESRIPVIEPKGFGKINTAVILSPGVVGFFRNINTDNQCL